MEIHVTDDLERAFTRAADARAGALIVTNDPTGIFLTNQEQILKLAAKNRLPAIYPQSTYVNAGGLVSYAADELENYRRAEQPRKFEFVINLKTAKQIGVTIPPNVLVRADRVIR